MGYDQKLDDKKRADTTGYLLKKTCCGQYHRVYEEKLYSFHTTVQQHIFAITFVCSFFISVYSFRFVFMS